MTDYKLHYFNLRVLGEPIRWILLASGTPFEDVRVPFDQWPALKPSMGWGQMPVLKFEGQELTQSVAISDYLGRKFNLTGSNDLEAAKCHEMVGHIHDLRAKWSVLYKETDEKKIAEIKKELLKDVFPPYLTKFNKIVEANGGKYLISSKPTWADYWLAVFLEIWEDTVCSDLLKDYPALRNQKETIMSNPKIQEWIAKRPKGLLNGHYI